MPSRAARGDHTGGGGRATSRLPAGTRAPGAPRRERGPRPQEPLRPREVAGARGRRRPASLLSSRAPPAPPRPRAPRRPRERLPGTERAVAPQAGRFQPAPERVLRAVGRLRHVSLHAMASEYMPEPARRRPLDERCPRSVYFLGDVGGRFMAPGAVGMPWGPKNRATGKTRKKFRRLLLLAFVLTAAFAVAKWSWIDAQARAVVALAAPRDAGRYAGRRGRDRRAAIRGDHRRREPGARRQAAGRGTVARDLLRQRRGHGGSEAARGAQAGGGAGQGGYLVVVPDLPGLRRGEIRPETVHETLEVARTISERGRTRDGTVGLGVSTGATSPYSPPETGRSHRGSRSSPAWLPTPT